ncbi:xanthine dehydrogenase family protein molybdopterin-binding subunit [Mesorhizobium sp. LHD-90]|uniref:xanthine dehydrogenase family protein molybdopterin-binding subunit n=1 Tax=Mesorhizobium sp. LHD-90 TaxID=3071414 RepID=UPI0027E1C7BA|nr:xanthine dehydrogenase family protein molybdopterin-binding subunit [Mesorhizobium sp. LHD-90]MDQ6433221.1 xanthine dehydrogenase family protein molybdopterin-binding subunit [Mesorhizobium sp. LHD-90]
MLKNYHELLGQSLPRLDGEPKVNGWHVYASDVRLPGMLVGRLLRSPHPHAAIRRIDVSAALAIPGVFGVITAADVPDVRFGVLVKDQTLFATDRVRFHGQPVAAVAARNEDIAERALAAIVVDYEVLEPIETLDQAFAPGATLIHLGWEGYEASPVCDRSGNVCNHSRIHYGDVKAALAKAHRVYEHSFTTPLQHAGYTEPRTSVAAWDSNGLVTIHTNCQLPFEVQQVVSEVMQIPLSSVRITVPGIGGGFGGKLRIGMEHYAAVLARHVGRPVRVSCTTEEELIAAHPRQAAHVTVKTAVDREGKLLARVARALIDCGAHAGSGPSVAANTLQLLAGPYEIEALDVQAYAVYTNKVPTGSFRAPSGPMANLAVESQMDIIARDLGLDPLEFRLKNVFTENSKGPVGEKLASVSIAECLNRAAEAIGWVRGNPEANRGKGMACGWWLVAGMSSGVVLRLNGDGTVTMQSGAVEIGTGALSGAAQILADELGLAHSDIHIAMADTQTSPYDYGSQGSRTLFNVGNACRNAAEDFKAQLRQMAGRIYGVPVEEVQIRDRGVVLPDKHVPMVEIAKIVNFREGGLLARGTTFTPGPAFDASRVKNHTLPAWSNPSFFAHAASVDVDEETGEITIRDYVACHDVGYAMNPAAVEGQIQGGVTQALGLALSEEIIYRDGIVQNANLTDYKMPTAQDVPDIRCVLVESPSVSGPHGVKGIGEPPCICPPAAVANAIATATGLRITSLPITAEKIVAARAA